MPSRMPRRLRRRFATVAATALLAVGLPTLGATEAQAATNSPPSELPYQSLGTFALTQDDNYAAYADKLANTLGSARSVDWILDNANRVPRSLSCETGSGGAMNGTTGLSSALGMCWNTDDAGTSLWESQGITTTADAYQARTYDGRRAVAVTWYAKDDSGRVRLTLMGADSSMDDQKYRHILLVKPTSTGSFSGDLGGCHAGGAAWYGHLLYVACTSYIRVFDWDHVYSANTADSCGSTVGTNRCAAGYALVMAQVGTVHRSSTTETFSSLAIDRVAAPDQLVVSEYSESTGGKLIRYKLDSSTRELATGSAYDAWTLPWARVQGAVTRGTRMWFNSSSGSSANGTLRFWDSDAGMSTTRNYTSTKGAESLSYWGWDDGAGGNPDRLYTLSEGAGRRAVVAVRQGDVD